MNTFKVSDYRSMRNIAPKVARTHTDRLAPVAHQTEISVQDLQAQTAYRATSIIWSESQDAPNPITTTARPLG